MDPLLFPKVETLGIISKPQCTECSGQNQSNHQNLVLNDVQPLLAIQTPPPNWYHIEHTYRNDDVNLGTMAVTTRTSQAVERSSSAERALPGACQRHNVMQYDSGGGGSMLSREREGWNQGCVFVVGNEVVYV